MSHPSRAWCFDRCQFAILAIVLCAAICGCKREDEDKPSVEITDAPIANAGGPAQMAFISGTAHSAGPGQQILLYAHSGNWWIQPTARDPFTRIQPDGTWKNATHLGTEYAALLVEQGYQPAVKLTALPVVGKGVAAVKVVPGKPAAPVVQKVIHFSGYDWNVRAAASARGGETNAYDPSNAWVDDKGYLHLRMGAYNGQWTCAEIYLTRSLGYGTYSFVVEDSSHLEPSAVEGLFILGDEQTDATRRELDVELGRWGDLSRVDAQYVVQPYYVPQNIYRFNVQKGTITHSFRWEPDSAAFRSYRTQARADSKPLSEHVFTSGIPPNTGEAVHIDLYDYHHSTNRLAVPTEVVIEKFQYLP